MANKHNRRFAAEQRRQQVTDLYLQGWSQPAIAEHLQVAQTTVSLDLRKVQEQWRESSIRNFDEIRSVELSKINLVEREAWAAWQRSQKPAQSAVVNGEGTSQRARKTLKNQYGDPRFLEQVNKCISQRRALLGLDVTPAISPIEGSIDGNVSLEARRERVMEILAAFSQHDRPGAIGAGSPAGQPGHICDGHQPGTLEAGSPS